MIAYDPRTASRWSPYYALLIFIVPYAVLSVPSIPQWQGRILGIFIFVLFGTFGALWYGLSLKTRMIRGGKLMQPQFDDIRAKLEFRWRMFVVAFAFAFTYFVALPFSRDLAYLASGKKPVEITATVQDKSVPLFGMWFVNQSVWLAPKERNYQLMYSLEPLRIGNTYEFRILPNSREIVDFRQLGATRAEGTK